MSFTFLSGRSSMGLTLLWSAPMVVQLHLATAVGALVLSLVQWAAPKGTTGHRALGYGWAALMMTTAAVSFAIHDLRGFGPFSPIHGLSVATLVGVPRAIHLARLGRVDAHRRLILILTGSTVVAGVFTLLPTRLLGKVVGW